MDKILYYNSNAYIYQTEDDMKEASEELYELQRKEENARHIDYCLRRHGVRFQRGNYVVVSKKKDRTWEVLGETRHEDLAACIAETAIRRLYINKDDIFVVFESLGFMTLDYAMDGPLKPLPWYKNETR
jgi:hypothetical protein